MDFISELLGIGLFRVIRKEEHKTWRGMVGWMLNV
jgi:hypothetical protein